MAAAPAAASTAWRLVHAPEWAGIQATGTYPGSALDVADGYLHMSPASQVRESAVRYFGGQADVVLLKIDLAPLAAHVRWDAVPARAASFPHLYGMLLPLSAVTAAYPLTWDAAAGAFDGIPDEVPATVAPVAPKE